MAWDSSARGAKIPGDSVAKTFFSDEHFQDLLVALLCYDRAVLRKTALFLSGDDFKPVAGVPHGRARWIVADRALSYYKKYHEPLAKLLRAELLRYSSDIGLGARQVAELEDYIGFLQGKKRVGAEAITDQVVAYKRDRIRAATLQEMVELQSAGQLDDSRWLELTRKVVGTRVDGVETTDYFAGVEARIERRQYAGIQCVIPLFFIEPLDVLVRGIGKGQLGLVLAPTARGKSLCLVWIAIAYTLQRLNVLLITLEDPMTELEDRLDSAISGVPIAVLSERTKTVRRRFRRFRRLLRTRLKLIDGTEGGMSVAQMEQCLLRERERGFVADAVIVDYDDEIVPEHKYKERRFEFADTYRALRRLGSQHGVIVWTASQTQRNTERLKILGGGRVAEDISKVQKASMAISLGQGEWGEDSLYLWVAKHRFDRQHVGCHIVSNRARMLIYDSERTRKAALEYGEGAERSEGDDDVT